MRHQVLPGSERLDTQQRVIPSVRVFGGMGVMTDAGPVSIGGRKQRGLLGLLALRAGSVASKDWLAEHLWCDSDRPDEPERALRTYVSRLRGALPKAARNWISTEGAGYCLDVPDVGLEHRRFAHLRAKAARARRRGDPLSALALLDQALALWRGEPFQELENCVVMFAEVERLRADHLDMLEERWECSLALGRHTQITGELGVFTSEHQLRCRAIRQFATALHRSGRTPEALRVVAHHRKILADESGLDPSAEMQELERTMLVGDNLTKANQVVRRVHKYRLLDEIGSGSFSTVWRGVQLSLDRDVAIKQIRPELASQPQFIDQFEVEARLIGRIEHPHVVPIIDFWRESDSAYIVMRLLRGKTLEQRLDDGVLSVEETLALADQIGDALSAAHDCGVIHRDVKPSNIMFDESGHAFLGDFGIALDIRRSGAPADVVSTGSPAYSAPEQIRREPLGPQADVFSLGVLLRECLTGEAMPAAGERQGCSGFARAGNTEPELPRHIDQALARATAHVPASRFATIAEFVAALHGDHFVREVCAPPAVAPVPQAPIGSLRRRPLTELAGV